MGSSHLTASIKKIEIINKVIKDEWQQSIRVILGDIELNNDTLVELRRFRPDEVVNVTFESVQLELFNKNKSLKDELTNKNNEADFFGDDKVSSKSTADGDNLLLIEEGEIILGEDEVIEKEFRF